MSTETEKAAADPRRQVTLNEVLGHDAARAYLRQALGDGSLPQALLICGPPGAGKKTLAWAVARELVAGGADAATHRGSLKVSRGTHPDVISLGGSAASGQIKVDDVRDMIEWTARHPLEADYKIVIIAPAERMNESSANALLKLLEEPPPHLRLLLVTSDAARVLGTIRSRCTPINLEAVEQEKLAPWLVTRAGAGRGRAELASRIAEGRPGQALSLLAEGGLETRSDILKCLTLLIDHGFAAVFGVAERLGSVMDDASAGLRMTALLLRDVLWVALGRGDVVNDDLRAELAAFGGRVAAEGVFEAAQLAESAAGEVGDYFTPAARQHFLESLAIRMGQALRKSG